MKSNVEIIVGEPIVEGKPTECFKMTVEYSHGDADFETEKVIHYTKGELDDLKRDYAALMDINDISDEDKVREYFEDQGMSSAEAEQAASDFRDAFYEGDRTKDQSTAAICSGVELCWYDSSGVKHSVEVKIDGVLV